MNKDLIGYIERVLGTRPMAALHIYEWLDRKIPQLNRTAGIIIGPLRNKVSFSMVSAGSYIHILYCYNPVLDQLHINIQL